MFQMASQSQTGPNGKQAPITRHQSGRDREKLVTVEKDLLGNGGSSGGHMGLSGSCDQQNALDSVNLHHLE